MTEILYSFWQDKTFGLKNKKGNKNQKYIAQVEKQIKSGGDPLQKKKEEERAAEKKKKEAALKLEEEQKALFRPVMTQKVGAGKASFLWMTAIYYPYKKLTGTNLSYILLISKFTKRWRYLSSWFML